MGNRNLTSVSLNYVYLTMIQFIPVSYTHLDQGFQDVVKGEWYADGVNWAAEKGLSLIHIYGYAFKHGL